MDTSATIAHIHQLAAADRHVVERVGRLLQVPSFEAGVIVGLVDGVTTSARELAAELGLSPGGAAALVERLEHHALVDHGPDPGRSSTTRLRLAHSAAIELRVALEPLAARVATAVAPFTPAERELGARYIGALASALDVR